MEMVEVPRHLALAILRELDEVIATLPLHSDQLVLLTGWATELAEWIGEE